MYQVDSHFSFRYTMHKQREREKPEINEEEREAI